MKIVFLCKRHPQQRDLLERPYGRFFYLPYFLSQHGVDVTIILVDYKNKICINREQHGMQWYVIPLNKYWPLETQSKIEAITQSMHPDWIVGFSDTWYGILANNIGHHHGYQVMIDAYDNYESYIPWCTPLHIAWRNACKNADLLTAAGPQLLELMNTNRSTDKKSLIVPMAADPIFKPLDMKECRTILNLPSGKLIGYLGSLHPSRDPKQFFDIVEETRRLDETIKFVISGIKHKSVVIPSNLKNHIIELGYLADDLMPIACNAADALLALGKPSSFGNYAYPVKIYEGLQCNKPVFTTRTASTEWILKNRTDLLINWNASEQVAKRLYSLNKIIDNHNVMDGWEERAKKILSHISI